MINGSLNVDADRSITVTEPSPGRNRDVIRRAITHSVAVKHKTRGSVIDLPVSKLWTTFQLSSHLTERLYTSDRSELRCVSLSLSLCLFMCVCVCARVLVPQLPSAISFTNTHTHTYKHTYRYIFLYLLKYAYLYINAFIYQRIYTYIYICVCVCVCVCGFDEVFLLFS